MPLASHLVGTTTAAVEHRVDARWLMAYAAGLGDTAPCYFDTTTALAMHPVFPVCIEWDSILDLRFGPGAAGMSAAEQARAIHADHDLHLLAPLQADTVLYTTATAVAVERRSPGAYLLKRLDSVDAQGRLVFRTWQGTLYRGVDVDGPDRQLEPAPASPAPRAELADGAAASLPVPAQAAHVYSECARIWNPIHTDLAHARAAGLPGLILHGTATLALAVSSLVSGHLHGDPGRVRRLGCRFSGMVEMPTMLSLRCQSPSPGLLVFGVSTPDGRAAITRAYLEYEP